MQSAALSWCRQDLLKVRVRALKVRATGSVDLYTEEGPCGLGADSSLELVPDAWHSCWVKNDWDHHWPQGIPTALFIYLLPFVSRLVVYYYTALQSFQLQSYRSAGCKMSNVYKHSLDRWHSVLQAPLVATELLQHEDSPRSLGSSDVDTDEDIDVKTFCFISVRSYLEETRPSGCRPQVCSCRLLVPLCTGDSDSRLVTCTSGVHVWWSQMCSTSGTNMSLWHTKYWHRSFACDAPQQWLRSVYHRKTHTHTHAPTRAHAHSLLKARIVYSTNKLFLLGKRNLFH